jgi:hypothetical protein
MDRRLSILIFRVASSRRTAALSTVFQVVSDAGTTYCNRARIVPPSTEVPSGVPTSIREFRAGYGPPISCREALSEILGLLPVNLIVLARVEMQPLKVTFPAGPNDRPSQRRGEPRFKVDAGPLDCEVGRDKLGAPNLNDYPVTEFVVSSNSSIRTARSRNRLRSPFLFRR